MLRRVLTAGSATGDYVTSEGRGWTDTAAPYDRLPARAEKLVRPPVWALVQNSAGLSVRFITDAQSITARWTLRHSKLSLPHMAATAVSGLDLYIRHEGHWRFLGVGRPTKFPMNQAVLTQGLAGGEQEFRLYLPLYNGVEKGILDQGRGRTDAVWSVAAQIETSAASSVRRAATTAILPIALRRRESQCLPVVVGIPHDDRKLLPSPIMGVIRDLSVRGRRRF